MADNRQYDCHKKYILMHKNVPVCNMKLDEASGAISAVSKAEAPAHVPVGIPVKKEHKVIMNQEKRHTSIPSEFREALGVAFPFTIPVLTGFLALGIAYGLLMQTKGFGVGWAAMMSAVAFCGSMQFVAITLLTAAFNPVQAFFMSLMVNARHLFYGISMLDKYHGLGKVRGFLIYVLCDETFSISSSVEPPEGISRKYFYLSISLLDYLYWIIGTFLGSVLGLYITFDTTGLDFVLTALFVVLFMEQWKKKENRTAGLIGLAGAAAALLLFGAEHFVIPAMLIILSILLIGRKKLCR